MALIMVAGTASLTSCLKNGQYYTDFSTAAASVYLPLAASYANAPVEFDFATGTTTTTMPVYIDVASPSLPTSATTATLAIDSTYLTTYNTAHKTSYLLPPSTAYKVSKTNMSVPAGQRLDSANLTIDFTQLDPTKKYIIPFTLSSASLPIEQWNHLMIYPVLQ
jgi:hypothetical protein